jgi:hypothetical protein
MFASGWKLAGFDALIKTGAWPGFDPTRTSLLETKASGGNERSCLRKQSTLPHLHCDTAPRGG